MRASPVDRQKGRKVASVIHIPRAGYMVSFSDQYPGKSRLLSKKSRFLSKILMHWPEASLIYSAFLPKTSSHSASDI